MRSIITALSCTVLAFSFLAGCMSRPIKPEDIRPIPTKINTLTNATQTSPKLTGLRAALDNQSRTSKQPVRILFVHGMLTNEEDYSLPTQRALAVQLGFCKSIKNCEPEKPNPDTDRYPLPRGYNPEMQFFGQSLEAAFPKNSDGNVKAPESIITKYIWRRGDKPALIVYSLFWAPTRDWVKNSLLGCFETYEAIESRNSKAKPPKAMNKICPPAGTFGAIRNTDRRLLPNKLLKDDLMVAGFGDAVTVVGAGGAVLEDDVQLAYCVMANDILSDPIQEAAILKTASEEAGKSLSSLATTKDRDDATKQKLQQSIGGLTAKSFALQVKAEDQRCSLAALTNDRTKRLETALIETPFFTVTESLGSYLTLKAHLSRQIDFSTRRSGSADKSVFFALLDKATIYMHANQISLLALTDLRARCIVSVPNNDCPISDPRIYQIDEPNLLIPNSVKTNVIAFNDRSDVLGYELPPYLGQTGYFENLLNVSVSNPALTLPGAVVVVPFLIKNPLGAHTNQYNNPAIIEFMVDGFDRPISAPK
jgi:hypothetical protein